MQIPSLYRDIRKTLPAEVSFGCGGIKLFSLDELEQAQVGYSIAPDRTSLCSGTDGAWQPGWIVIGIETACGDPLFLEADNSALPVYTAMHGEGAWHSNPLAASVEIFAQCVEEFVRISRGRATPTEREANPMNEEERSQFLRRIAGFNRAADPPEFWEMLLEC